MASEAQKKGTHVWFVVHRQELMQQTIDSFDRFGLDRSHITIGMVGTIARHLEDYPEPQLIVFDEAHFSMAAQFQKIRKYYPNAWLVGLTASPCRLDGKPLGEIYKAMAIGVTTKQLIDMGMLSKYRYYSVSATDLTGLKKRGGDYSQEQAEELLSKPAIFGNVIENYIKFASGLKTIIYCATVSHSEKVAEAFQREGFKAVHFDGDTRDKKRKQIISDFKSDKIDILCNCDLISVGFDCPAVSCVIMLRPTMSTALFIQQSGRALRPLEGKEAIVIDMVANYSRHGLIDDDREWSLTNTVKQKQQEQATNCVRQCEKCYFTYRSNQTVCPNCGHINARSKEEIKQIENAKLQEIKDFRLEKKKEIKPLWQCKSYEDFLEIERAMKYKSGWAYIKAKQRGYI